MFKKLKRGDTIGVVGASNSIKRETKENTFERAKKLFFRYGYKLKFSDNVNKDYYGMAGEAREKARELNEMFQDNSVDAIIILDGGHCFRSM